MSANTVIPGDRFAVVRGAREVGEVWEVIDRNGAPGDGWWNLRCRAEWSAARTSSLLDPARWRRVVVEAQR